MNKLEKTIMIFESIVEETSNLEFAKARQRNHWAIKQECYHVKGLYIIGCVAITQKS